MIEPCSLEQGFLFNKENGRTYRFAGVMATALEPMFGQSGAGSVFIMKVQ